MMPKTPSSAISQFLNLLLDTMAYLSSLLTIFLLIPFNTAFVVDRKGTRTSLSGQWMASASEGDGSQTSRRQLLQQLTAGALLIAPTVARADVSDGNTLPRGALQFNRVIRLRRDLKVRYDFSRVLYYCVW
jgi:hypothetical protein